MAASLRGQTRVTADVDMVILADVSEALSLVASLETTKFQTLFADVAAVVERSFILPLRHRTTKVKLDLALGLSGFERQAVARAEPIEIAGIQVRVVSAEDLLIMKILAGRPQDEQDARAIVTAQEHQMDWEYCHAVAKDLGDALGQDLLRPLNNLRKDQSLD